MASFLTWTRTNLMASSCSCGGETQYQNWSAPSAPRRARRRGRTVLEKASEEVVPPSTQTWARQGCAGSTPRSTPRAISPWRSHQRGFLWKTQHLHHHLMHWLALAVCRLQHKGWPGRQILDPVLQSLLQDPGLPLDQKLRLRRLSQQRKNLLPPCSGPARPFGQRTGPTVG